MKVGEMTRIPDGGRYTVCEDHFDLEDDSTNWMFYKIMGKKLMLRSDVPHRNSNNQYRQSVNRL
ncbi:hypothetical protein NQ317_013461 [Molorchus minor]|uniref:Uncharacterized protein n=1 Tax=Molorchus minor TaxID=1323400 RepID=A0ABQ9J6C9_9CUCU|nr:hypothetical protein NQ317_013461 [Molorchus minor]